MTKMQDSLFEDIVETRIAADGTVDASVRPDAEHEMENAVADLVRSSITDGSSR